MAQIMMMILDLLMSRSPDDLQLISTLHHDDYDDHDNVHVATNKSMIRYNYNGQLASQLQPQVNGQLANKLQQDDR